MMRRNPLDFLSSIAAVAGLCPHDSLLV